MLEIDDILINKVDSIRRCVKRAREEYNSADNFKDDFSRQDAAIMNIVRACEQAIDLTNYIIKKRKLGVPNSAKDSFDLLFRDKIIGEYLCEKMKKMIGFRNIVIHDYEKVNIDIVTSVIKNESEDLLVFSDLLLNKKI
jgi:uncharacterized protein YutE (UPF0331/DUF86 family)